MKKLILVVLSLVLVLVLVLSLRACSSGKGPKETAPPQEAEGPTTPAKCVHAYVESIAEEATCTNDGTKTFTCSTCGESYTESIEKAAHAYIDATCTAPKTCELCGATKGEALPHTFKDATCSAPKTCSDCGTTEGAALGHSYKNATCTTAKTCSVCGATSGAALGHKYENEGCTGEKTCSVCGDTKQNSHSWKDATCLAPKTCSVCGETEGEALGHTLTATCARCGEASAAYAELVGTKWVWSYRYRQPGETYWSFALLSFLFEADGKVHFAIDNYRPVEYCARVQMITIAEFKESVPDGQFVMVDGIEYYYDGRTTLEMTYTENNGTVTVNLVDAESMGRAPIAVMHRTGYAEYTMTEGDWIIDEATVIPIGKYHTFADATCNEPKTCLACGATKGEPLDHSFANGFCTACGEEVPNV